MALRNFAEPHCGESNPLIKLSHHVTKDKSHREDLYSWSTPSAEVQLSPEQLVEEFMNETKLAVNFGHSAFRMDSLLQEMQEIERAPPTIGPAVADLASEAGTWAREYLDSEAFVQEVPPADWTNDFLENQINSSKIDLEAPWNEALQSNSKYNHLEDSELAKTANELLGTVDDPKFSNTEFMKYMRKLGQGSKGDEWGDEFISYSNSMADAWTNEFSSQLLSHDLPKYQQWEHEFETAQDKDPLSTNIDSEAMTSDEKNAFWKQLQDNWEKATTESNEIEHPWLSDFENESTNPFKNYAFQDNNPLKNHPDPLAEGKKYLQMGDIPSAILLFEAAAQQNPSNSEAWLLLGTTHAENEQDPSAIAALKRGLEQDPSNLNGWMSLATSYTNESYQNFACEALKEWIRNNVEYRHLLEGDTSKNSTHQKVLVGSLAPRELIDEVQNLYLKAANLRPADKFDCDVQCGLGILLNLTGEYGKAVDCFNAAIEAKPLDPKLWNKLGATLANSNQSAEAIDAYRRSLELSPGFIRCRYNLGVACINLGAHREAIGHFLEGLNMQERSRLIDNKSSSLAVSDNIWSTLRLCLRSLNAQHLITAVLNRDLKKLNEEFGSNE